MASAIDSNLKCSCQLKCSENLSPEKIQEIRTLYQAQKTYVNKSSFIANLIEEAKVGRHRKRKIPSEVKVDQIYEEDDEEDEEEDGADSEDNDLVVDETTNSNRQSSMQEGPSQLSNDNHVNRKENKRKKKKPKKVITWEYSPQIRRRFHRIYTLQGVKVCKLFFLKVLNISSSRCNTALVKVRSNDVQDHRGAYGGWNKLKGPKLEKVLEHIASIPRFEPSEGVRFENVLSMPKGKNLVKYYEEYKLANPDDFVGLSSYKKIFYKQVKLRNLEKDSPLKQMSNQLPDCTICQSFQIKLSNGADRNIINKAKKEHDDAWNEADAQFKMDIDRANSDISFDCLVFDIAKTGLPCLNQASKEFRKECNAKQKLDVYNLIIYSAKQRETWFYLWLESEAGYGPEEIGSVLMRHILHEMITEVREVSIYSDSKPSHKTLRMCLLLKSMVEETCSIEVIRFRYVLHEHTELPTDSDLAFVERSVRKQQNIFSDEHFVSLLAINPNRSKRKGYIVQRMASWQFYTSQAIMQFVSNHNIATNGARVDWTNLKEIQLNLSQPNVIYIKQNNLREDYSVIDLFKGDKGALPYGFSWRRELSKLWLQGRRITKQKWYDLSSMLHMIPAEYHHIYTRLKVVNECEDCDPNRDHRFDSIPMESNIVDVEQQQHSQDLMIDNNVDHVGYHASLVVKEEAVAAFDHHQAMSHPSVNFVQNHLMPAHHQANPWCQFCAPIRDTQHDSSA